MGKAAGNVNKVQGRAALTHAEPFDLRVPSACANRELPELPQQFTRRVAKLQLGGQRSVPPLPSCDIKREAPAERRDRAFPAEQVRLRPSLAGASSVPEAGAGVWGQGGGCEWRCRWVGRSSRREG